MRARTRSVWCSRFTGCAASSELRLPRVSSIPGAAYNTSLLFTVVMLAGVIGWAVSAGIYPLMAGSVAVWGLGFASTNSMQQVRLVGAAPALASASVSLNTSVLYIGQAAGSAIGGMLFARDLLHGAGYVAAAFIALALMVVILTKPRRAAGLST
jgi:MFS transporter, DHA1 family, inner membrane transport protein